MQAIARVLHRVPILPKEPGELHGWTENSCDRKRRAVVLRERDACMMRLNPLRSKKPCLQMVVSICRNSSTGMVGECTWKVIQPPSSSSLYIDMMIVTRRRMFSRRKKMEERKNKREKRKISAVPNSKAVEVRHLRRPLAPLADGCFLTDASLVFLRMSTWRWEETARCFCIRAWTGKQMDICRFCHSSLQLWASLLWRCYNLNHRIQKPCTWYCRRENSCNGNRGW